MFLQSVVTELKGPEKLSLIWLFRESGVCRAQPRLCSVRPKGGSEPCVRDIELYRAILGLTTPAVANVALDVKGQQVVVQVDRALYLSGVSGAAAPRYDGKARRWRYLDTYQLTPGSRPRCRESSARRTGSSSSVCCGQRRGVAVHGPVRATDD